MWNRVEFKRRGRAAFLANFFRCVIVALIVGLVTTGARASGRAAGENQGNQTIQSGTLAPGITYDLSSNQPEQVQQLENELAQYMPGNYLSTFLLIGGGILACIALLLQIFIFSVLQVGGCAFFTRNARSRGKEESLGALLTGFQNGNYGTIVLTQFLRDLFIMLWSLLLIIPGIIKSYEYMMVPYILADYPDVTRQEAFAMSKEMMNGNKLNMFVLELSFIGWYILGAFTLGILNVLFTDPYLEATRAEAYLALKQQTYGQTFDSEPQTNDLTQY
jgi:uncharacterized membrane protein